MLAFLSRIHPAVSGFGLAFLLLLAVVELPSLVRFRRPAMNGWVPLIALGVALVVTFFSGYLAYGFINPTEDPSVAVNIAHHHVVGRWGLLAFPLMPVARQFALRRRDAMSAVLYAVLLVGFLALVGYGSLLGGGLVFDLGVGVRR